MTVFPLDYYLTQIQQSLSSNQPDQAIDWLKQAMHHYWANTELHYWMAKALFAQAKYEEAIPYIEFCLHEEKTNGQFLYFNACIILALSERTEDTQKRTDLLRGLLEKVEDYLKQEDDSEPILLTSKGIILIRLNDYVSARSTLQTAISRMPQYIDALVGIGYANFMLGEYQSSIQYYQEVIRLDDKHGSAWHSMGCAYWKLNNYSEAVQSYRQAHEISPLNANWKSSLTNALERIRDTGEAN